MPSNERTASKLQSPGPFIATITNLLDPSFMGSLEVAVEKGFSSDPGVEGQTYVVRYLSPFYGVTGVQYEGNNPASFSDVQKSYGMWMVPPDVGTQVLVIFVEGDPNQGFWIGCIPDMYQNHMIPGIASSEKNLLSQKEKTSYGTSNVPVAEFHKRSAKSQVNPNAQQKAVHPFTNTLLTQGLLADTVRGTTTSSARREAPSMVFGISTPGPIDKNGKKGLVGSTTSKATIPVSRLGGTQFVMDDGDSSGNNELVRLRTRTGHQILLHNTEDLVYIANSSGSAWIELSSNGKIDVYAQDSVSIHTAQDFNFFADRDVNVQAGRSINLKAVNGSIRTEGVDFSLKTTGGDTKITTAGSFHLKTESNNLFTAGDATYIKSGGNHIETAAAIHMNGPIAADASSADSLSMYKVPNVDSSSQWSGGKMYSAGTVSSIMKRVPMHEPWPHHENVNPDASTPENTSRE